ncbi:hypothetical protein [Haloarchaeobius sp. DFWS5]|uniref:hypothetical protein n=1 Tax=Haloarchaeobius sp. DFWS5 TaxID=3446114 RepID=UPI003EBFA997
MTRRFRFALTLLLAVSLAVAIGGSTVAASDGETAVGICLVGVDSPCNGAADEADDRSDDEPDAKPPEDTVFPPDPDGDPAVARPVDPEPNWREPGEPINDFRDDVPLMNQSGLVEERPVPEPMPPERESPREHPEEKPRPSGGDVIYCIRAPCELPPETEPSVDGDVVVDSEEPVLLPYGDDTIDFVDGGPGIAADHGVSMVAGESNVVSSASPGAATPEHAASDIVWSWSLPSALSSLLAPLLAIRLFPGLF